jgi:hypothetical protein
MQTNEQGQVAIRRYRQNQRQVIVDQATKKFYLFRPQHNICLAWVDPEDVDKILAIKRKCCGGAGSPEFYLADEYAVRVWTHGGR